MGNMGTMIKNVYVKAIFILLLLNVFNPAFSQNCSYTVKASVSKISDCESNGIVKAVLEGKDVSDSIIQLYDAKYSIESVPAGGYSKTFDVNGGVLPGVPPGKYIVTARAFCKRTNSWIDAVSNIVEMQGTYPGFDINQIEIQTAGIIDSKTCSPTGSVPIKVGSGKKPYYARITAAPDPSLIGKTYTTTNAGILLADSLLAGQYTFDVFDDCGYTVVRKAKVNEIVPVYKVEEVIKTPVCDSLGSIRWSMVNGTLPYTIAFTNTPAGYNGPDTIIVHNDAGYTLTNLPEGTYKYTISDVCPQTSKPFSTIVGNIPPQIEYKSKTVTAPCKDSATVTFKLSGGKAPYILKTDVHPGTDPLGGGTLTITPWGADTTITIKGLAYGTYKFSIKDDCQSIAQSVNVKIDTLKLKVTETHSNPTACDKNDGTATINVSQGLFPFVSATLVNTSTGTLVTLPSPTDPSSTVKRYSVKNLSAGNYVFAVEDGCNKKDTIRFTLTRDSLEAVVKQGFESFECAGVGTFSVKVNKGTPQFKVEIISGPSQIGYKDSANNKYPEFAFKDLLPGNYQVQVTDKCDTLLLDAFVDTLEWNDATADLYEDYFYSYNDPDCKKIEVRRKTGGSSVFQQLWKNRPDLFEVAFVASNDTTTNWKWRNVRKDNKDTVSFPNDTGYCDARSAKLTFTAHVRLKNGSLGCDTLHDVIKFRELSSTLAKLNESCDGFSIKLTHDSRNIICFPFKYYLIDTTTNDIIDSATFNNLNAAQINNLQPHGTYKVRFKDKEGCEWDAKGIVSTEAPPNGTPTITYFNEICDNYSIKFTFSENCYPFEWFVCLQSDTTDVLGGRNIPNVAADTIPHMQDSLKFGVKYWLYVLSNQKKHIARYPIEKAQTIYTNYKADFTPSFCLPDTAKGYIRLFRPGSPNEFEEGSVIKFVSGPTTPIHTNDTIKNNSTTEFYPFSSDSLAQVPELQMIEEGAYMFEVIDTCGRSNIINLQYSKSRVENFGYTPDSLCASMNIETKGKIWVGSQEYTTYFRIRTTPPGIAANTNVVTEGGFLTLNETGRYTLQISIDSSKNSCPFDTLTIDYIRETVSLDADSTLTYVCDESNDGYIKVKRKGGVGPFTYYLYDKDIHGADSLVASNALGEFSYGKYGKQYRVIIDDEGCGVKFPVDVFMLDISKERVISDDITLCKGDTIKMRCLSIGAYSGYSWSGPNGWTSTDQNPVIPDADTSMNGAYNIQVMPAGCALPITQTVNITVIDPRQLPDTTIVYCVGDATSQFTTVADAGHYLKWYDKDTIAMGGTNPTPAVTSFADTVDYFVSQINSIYGCEGDKARIRVVYQAFPDTIAYGFADSICKDAFPVVTIPGSFADYVYSLYNTPSGGMAIVSDTAFTDTLRINSPQSFANSGFLYVEVQTKHRCVSTKRSKVPVTVVIPPVPVVYDTLYCVNDVAIPVRADSTTRHRLQWYDSDGTTTLPVAPTPSTATANIIKYYVAQVDTLLGCVGPQTELTVTVIALPDTLVNAQVPDICPDESPSVIVNNSFNGYTYTLFDKNSDTIVSVKSTLPDGSPLLLTSSSFTLPSSDTLYVEIQNQHRCTSKDRAMVLVTVVPPPPPVTYDTLYCVDDNALPLKADATSGYSLKWYLPDNTSTFTAPTPSTTVADTITYYVTQINDLLGCESDSVPLVVIVEALPDTVAVAFSNDICAGDNPVITIPETFNNYEYRLYNIGKNVVGTGIGTGDTITIISGDSFTTSGHLFIEVQTYHRCVSREQSRVPVTVVIPPAPVPYDTLYCVDDTAFPVHADSTAGNRLQWYEADGVTKLPNAPTPSTITAGMIKYFVSQIDLRLGCEGPQSLLQVEVVALPDTLIQAKAPDICPESAPVFIIENAHAGYTYTVFDKKDNDNVIVSDVSTGSTLSLSNPAFTLSKDAVFYIEIQNQHMCTSKGRATVPVHVEIPPAPVPYDTMYCVDDVAVAMRADVTPGYSLIWFDVNLNVLSSAPIPSTVKADTIHYWVAQRHILLGCESEKVPAKAVIIGLPDTVKAYALPICPGMHPTIVIKDVLDGHTYNIYTVMGSIVGTATGTSTSDSLVVKLSETIDDPAYYYVETVNPHECSSKDRATVYVSVENTVYIMPEAIPPYKRGYYSYQLKTNAVSPYVFTVEDMMPLGFSLTTGGLIIGNPPGNYSIDPIPFTIKVVDANGCEAIKEYVLESDEFIPEVFTPNGDGKNDVFQKGRRLVIFDRLGLKIFEGDDGWDGTRMDGTPAPPDTYFYLIYYEDDDLMTNQKKGYITLVRRN